MVESGDSEGLRRAKIQKNEEDESVPKNLDKQTLLIYIDKLKQVIWKRRPILGNIMKKHGNKTLYEYAREFLDVNPAPGLDERKVEVIQVVKELLSERLGADVAGRVAAQLIKLPLVSTADHHAPIDHPFWVNSNIISALPGVDSPNHDLEFMIDFSFASVSANNASGFPRGIMFHGEINGRGNLIRLPLLPDKLKMGVVVRMEPITKGDIEKALVELDKRERASEILPERARGVRDCISKYFDNDDILGCKDFCSQITKVNFKMWGDLFHAAKSDGKALSKNVPDLIYLEIETIAERLLLEKHLNNKDSLIYKFLFGEGVSSLVYKLFEKIPGAFSLKTQWGTYMFWATDEKYKRVALMLKNGKLRSQDNSFVFDWNSEAIVIALRQRKIFPGMMLCYVMISLYYGMKCLGGFSQVNDLTLTKEAWQEYLMEVGNEEEADRVEPVQTKELGGDGMVLVYMETSDGKIVQATGIDMILDEGNTDFNKYIELSKKVTLAEAMDPMIPEMYEVLYSQKDRDPVLDSIIPEQIFENSSIYEKLK